MATDDRDESHGDDRGDPGETPPGESDATDPRIGAVATREVDSLVTLVGHFYRGQLDRETSLRSRLDRTTDWAVLVIATLLTWTFSTIANPHYILLIGGLLVAIFLGVESHRYRAYHVPRTRVRMLEEDLFAGMFDPDSGGEHADWREVMSEDLKRPAAKISRRAAVARRLRRVYLPLFTILLVAWFIKITAFEVGKDVFAAAALPPISGRVVVGGVVAFYAGLVLIALWPSDGHGHREFHEETAGDRHGGE